MSVLNIVKISKKVRKVLNALIEKEPARITDEPVKIYVNEFQASSIDIGIRYWVKNRGLLGITLESIGRN